ncbi:MAG: hypothetical protein N3B21_02945 [Clostridia bacterium]|nr:hypothetical protein [Clostridia bacterium]
MINMLKALYGTLKFERKADYFIMPLKVLYIIYSIPFLVFAFLLMLRSFGAFGSPKNERIGIIKKVLLHFADVFWSFVLWGIIINAILGNYDTN